MGKKLLYYIMMTTGIVIVVVGLLNFFLNYGDTTLSGIWNQITGPVLVAGGIINLLYANKIKQNIIKVSNPIKDDDL